MTPPAVPYRIQSSALQGWSWANLRLLFFNALSNRLLQMKCEPQWCTTCPKKAWISYSYPPLLFCLHQYTDSLFLLFIYRYLFLFCFVLWQSPLFLSSVNCITIKARPQRKWQASWLKKLIQFTFSRGFIDFSVSLKRRGWKLHRHKSTCKYKTCLCVPWYPCNC